jgi:uncharacterized repeat protein (TIGR03803 family)
MNMSRSDWRASAAVTALLLAPLAPAEAAWHVTVLHDFDQRDGAFPNGALVADAAGHLYGTTEQGGKFGYGAVYEVSPPALGSTHWSSHVLHSFGDPAQGGDGAFPTGSLAFDAKGNLYGTTGWGGAADDGTVFRLAPPAVGRTEWTETVLHGFSGGDGVGPEAGVVLDAAGNLYGTAANGGRANDGTVFKLAPPATGQTAWTATVLHAFGGTDGHEPVGGLALDSAGNLYGTTEDGGAYNYGIVFKLAPPAAGHTKWVERVLRSFSQTDAGGSRPMAGVTLDLAGNLYGTSYTGGLDGSGTVFKLEAPVPGKTKWVETVLRTFVYHGQSGTTGEGSFPAAGVVLDAAGNVYGTTVVGGTSNGATVFRLSPPQAGHTKWTESVLRSFPDATGQGSFPESGVILGLDGAVFGTTYAGGTYGAGSVFALTP